MCQWWRWMPGTRVNPNSYESVIIVLQHLGRDVRIRQYVKDGKREWLTVVCDRLPYIIALKLLKDTYRCDAWKTSVYGLETYKKHMTSAIGNTWLLPIGNTWLLRIVMWHHNNGIFEWLHLRIGHGLYGPLIPIYELGDLHERCGVCQIQIPNTHARSRGDHHKSWELMTIMFHGTLDLLPAVRPPLHEQKGWPISCGLLAKTV